MHTTLLLASILAFAPQGADLSGNYGFEPLEVQKIDPKGGPLDSADMDGDGRKDLIAVNNHKSRIEIYYQKPDAKPGDVKAPAAGSNELPELWRFRRETISVPNEVQAVVPFDYDGDGRMDLIYAGQPGTIALVRQTKPGVFEVVRKFPMKGLAGNRDNLHVANVIGDAKPEIVGNVGGKVMIWPLEKDQLGTPTELDIGAGNVVASVIDDFDGNGTPDVMGVVPEDASPLRIWLSSREGDKLVLGPQLRFEMPPLREAETVRLPGEKQALIGTIERPSKRIVFSRMEKAPIAGAGDREASIQTWAFKDPQNRKRSYAVVDLDGDGRQDLLATNTAENAVMLYRQRAGKGFDSPERYPALADLDAVAALPAADGKPAQVFLLSEKEGVLGRCDAGTDGIGFPKPVPLTAGATPVKMNLVTFNGTPSLAVVTKDGRNYTLTLVPATGEAAMDAKNHRSVSIGSLSRNPESILGVDVDHEGHTDLLVFTPDKPMIMVREVTDKDGKSELKTLESKDMGQFGLVQAANGRNTAVFDVLGDGKAELLVADRNYVRALRYDAAPPAGTSPGWQVVKQLNADASDAKLTCVSVMGDRVVAGDPDSGRLVVFGRDDKGAWKQVETIEVPGFKFNQIFAGKFGGDDNQSILAIGDDSFALVRLAGDRWKLTEVASWRSDEPRRVEHELVVGDVNGDGFVDVTALDAGEQMAEILSFSQAGKLRYGTAFKVFETKIFSGGEPKEFEPSMGLVTDLTGDGKDDLVLLCHDRVLLYPQQTKAEAAKPAATTPR
jgi:hypothetical protein